ncbi:hypothetical protein ACLESD_41415 [Pyxidicoccus sp. 3LFB2]
MRIQFKLPKERFIAPEERSVRLTLRNEGTAPVEMRDPFRDADQSLTYTLTGPEYPEGRSVSWRSFALMNPAYNLTMDVAPRIQLGAGQAIEFFVDVHEWLPATRPGRYRLSAQLSQEPITATAAPVEFDIVPSTAGPASLGVDVDGHFTPGVGAVWFQDTGGQRLLLGGGYDDFDSMETGGVTWRPATVLGPVEPGSTDAMYPWSNDPQGMSSVRWMMWRNGASLLALAQPATMENPFRFDLGAPPERIIRPPVATITGELFVAVVGAGGKNLRLIRFQSSCDATEVTPGREVGRVPLPGVPIAARATVQPASLGNGLSLLVVEEAHGGLDLHHIRTTSTGRLTRVASTLLRGVRAMPQSEPGLWIDSAGRLHAALVTASLKNPRQPMLAELRYRADGRLEAPARLTPLAKLPVAPRAAVVRHHPRAQRNGELTWAILMEDGRLLHKGTWQGPMTPKHPPALPLDLYLGDGPHLLTVDPTLGASFEPLR